MTKRCGLLANLKAKNQQPMGVVLEARIRIRLKLEEALKKARVMKMARKVSPRLQR
jgi:hypothetical protein